MLWTTSLHLCKIITARRGTGVSCKSSPAISGWHHSGVLSLLEQLYSEIEIFLLKNEEETPTHLQLVIVFFLTYFKTAWRRCTAPRIPSSAPTLSACSPDRKNRKSQMWGCRCRLSNFDISSSVWLRSTWEETAPVSFLSLVN